MGFSVKFFSITDAYKLRPEEYRPKSGVRSLDIRILVVRSMNRLYNVKLLCKQEAEKEGFGKQWEAVRVGVNRNYSKMNKEVMLTIYELEI